MQILLCDLSRKSETKVNQTLPENNIQNYLIKSVRQYTILFAYSLVGKMLSIIFTFYPKLFTLNFTPNFSTLCYVISWLVRKHLREIQKVLKKCFLKITNNNIRFNKVSTEKKLYSEVLIEYFFYHSWKNVSKYIPILFFSNYDLYLMMIPLDKIFVQTKFQTTLFYTSWCKLRILKNRIYISIT